MQELAQETDSMCKQTYFAQTGVHQPVPVNWTRILSHEYYVTRPVLPPAKTQEEKIQRERDESMRREFTYSRFMHFKEIGFRSLYVKQQKLEKMSLWQLRHAQCWDVNIQKLKLEGKIVPNKNRDFEKERLRLLIIRTQEMIRFMTKQPPKISLYVYLCLEELKKLKGSILHFTWKRPQTLQQLYYYVKLFDQYGWYLPVPIFSSPQSFSQWYMSRVKIPSPGDLSMKEWIFIQKRKQMAQYATFLFFLRLQYPQGLKRVLKYDVHALRYLYKLFYRYLKNIPLRYQLIEEFKQQLRHEFFREPKVRSFVFKEQKTEQEKEKEKRRREELIEAAWEYQISVGRYLSQMAAETQPQNVPQELSEARNSDLHKMVAQFIQDSKNKIKQAQKFIKGMKKDKKTKKREKAEQKQEQAGQKSQKERQFFIQIDEEAQKIKQVHQQMIKKVNEALIYEKMIQPAQELGEKLQKVKEKISFNDKMYDHLTKDGFVYSKYSHGKYQFRCNKCAFFLSKQTVSTHVCDPRPLTVSPRLKAPQGTIQLYRKTYGSGFGRCIGCLMMYSVRVPHQCCISLPKNLKLLTNQPKPFQVCLSDEIIDVTLVKIINEQPFRQNMILNQSIIVGCQDAKMFAHPFSFSPNAPINLRQTNKSLETLTHIQYGTYFGLIGGQIFPKDLKLFYGSTPSKSTIKDEIKFLKQIEFQQKYVFLPVQHYTGLSFIEVDDNNANCEIVLGFLNGNLYSCLLALKPIFRKTKLYLKSTSNSLQKLFQQIKKTGQMNCTMTQANKFVKSKILDSDSQSKSIIAEVFEDEEMLQIFEQAQKAKPQIFYSSSQDEPLQIQCPRNIKLDYQERQKLRQYEQRIQEQVQYLQWRKKYLAQNQSENQIEESKPKFDYFQNLPEAQEDFPVEVDKNQLQDIQKQELNELRSREQRQMQDFIEKLAKKPKQRDAQMEECESSFEIQVIPEVQAEAVPDSDEQINQDILDQCMLNFIENEVNQFEKKEIKPNPLFKLFSQKMEAKQQDNPDDHSNSELDFEPCNENSEAYPLMKWPEQSDAKQTESVADSLVVQLDSAFETYKCQN